VCFEDLSLLRFRLEEAPIRSRSRAADDAAFEPLGTGAAERVTTTERVAIRERAASRTMPAWLGAQVSAVSSWSVLLAWGAVTVLVPVLEPAPAHPETGVWATLLGVAMSVGLLATMAGVALRRRAGLWASAAVSIVAIAAAVMCPVSGHHRFGLWWVAELAVLGVAAATTERALRRG
jgi:hypothetical protein